MEVKHSDFVRSSVRPKLIVVSNTTFKTAEVKRLIQKVFNNAYVTRDLEQVNCIEHEDGCLLGCCAV
jgi:hypothetical protein